MSNINLIVFEKQDYLQVRIMTQIQVVLDKTKCSKQGLLTNSYGIHVLQKHDKNI